MEASKNPPMIAMTICPAVIFAPNRRARIRGRTPILTVSMRIKNGLSREGAPEGRNDAITFCGSWLIPEIMRVVQKGKLKERVIARCLVSPKT
jgi:hypothetical protein